MPTPSCYSTQVLYSLLLLERHHTGRSGLFPNVERMIFACLELHSKKGTPSLSVSEGVSLGARGCHSQELLSRQVMGKKGKPYVPDFKKAFEHVCIHTGGRGVIDEMQKQLRMTPELMQPSRDALYRYGNVSSSSIW